MRSLCLVLAVAACGDGAPAKPDAAAPSDTGGDTGSNGTDVDLTFGTNGTAAVTGGMCWSFAVDTSDRPIVLTNVNSDHMTVVRYDTKGQPDASFAPHPLGTNAVTLPQLFVLPSGKLLVTAIDMVTNNVQVYRMTPDGTIDLDLAMPPKLHVVFGAGERSDGGVDLVGVGDKSDDAFTFARITADGTVDTTFGDQGVAAPATPNIPPGYFPHAVYVGDGTFVLSGASFAQTNAQGGVGPITGHLLVATDGAITTTTTTDNHQFLWLAPHGTQVYALMNSYPAMTGVISRFGDDAVIDDTFASTEASTFAPNYGLYNGGALAVAPDGSLIATNGETLDRFHPDGNTRSTMADHFDYCGLAMDSHGRPLVASSTTMLRLVQ